MHKAYTHHGDAYVHTYVRMNTGCFSQYYQVPGIVHTYVLQCMYMLTGTCIAPYVRASLLQDRAK